MFFVLLLQLWQICYACYMSTDNSFARNFNEKHKKQSNADSIQRAAAEQMTFSLIRDAKNQSSRAVNGFVYAVNVRGSWQSTTPTDNEDHWEVGRWQ